jgi:transglutaminase-like putative cysteine protease
VIRYRVVHRTRYLYADAVSLCHNVAHLTPRDYSVQSLESSIIHISPFPASRVDRPDYFGNPTTYFSVQDPHTELKIEATHTIAVWPRPSVEMAPAWNQVRDRLPNETHPSWLDAMQYRFDTRSVATQPEYAQYATPSFAPGRPISEAVADLTSRIFKDYSYDPRATTVATPLKEVFEKRRGVCQDFAHIQVACLRSLGLAARYVSGYLSTTPPPGKPRLIGADASHAWISVFCGDAGWLEFDPTNNQIANERYILLAWGRDYSDVCPVSGVILGGGAHQVKVAVDAIPEDELVAAGA